MVIKTSINKWFVFVYKSDTCVIMDYTVYVTWYPFFLLKTYIFDLFSYIPIYPHTRKHNLYKDISD